MAVHASPSRPILLTRPRAASDRLAAELSGAEVVIAPLMDIVGTGAQVSFDGIKGLIFTSANAVPFAPQAPVPAFCVGPRTAAAAHASGFDATQVGEDAESLIAGLLRIGPDGPLVHLHGTHVRGSVAETLTAQGLMTSGIAVYDQKIRPPDTAFRAAVQRTGVIVPLFSPRSAALFAQAVDTLPADAIIIALSPGVAAALPKEWAPNIQTLNRPDPGQMRDALQAARMRRISP